MSEKDKIFTEEFLSKFSESFRNDSHEDEGIMHLNFFDEYSIGDNELLSELVRILSKRYNIRVKSAIKIVKMSFVSEMILDNPVFIHHEDTEKLIKDICEELIVIQNNCNDLF